MPFSLVTFKYNTLVARIYVPEQRRQPRTSCPPNQTAAWAVPETGEGVSLAGAGKTPLLLTLLTCRGPPLLALACVLIVHLDKRRP